MDRPICLRLHCDCILNMYNVVQNRMPESTTLPLAGDSQVDRKHSSPRDCQYTMTVMKQEEAEKQHLPKYQQAH